MERMIDHISKENHGLVAIHTWVITPLKALTTAIHDNEFTSDSLAALEALTEMLHEKVCECDDRISELVEQG